MSREDKIKKLVAQYIDVREKVYHSITTEGLSSNSRSLNQEKKGLEKTILDSLNHREYDVFAKGFQEIIGMSGSRIPGCSTQEMGVYLKNSNSVAYLNCLNLQKNALIELVDEVVRPLVTIVDAEDGIIVCNGICHPE